ncbi:MAG: repair exonuclease [Bacillales bacterium]|nr:repair exonuclease [Bacillales bacterium]
MIILKSIRFLHAADLHLGAKFRDFQNLPKKYSDLLNKSGYVAFRKLIDKAIEEQVDFVIFAGDIYNVEDKNLKAQVEFQKGMKRLYEHSIPVYVIHGNHDFLGGTKFNLALPKNVHVFSKQVEHKQLTTKSGETVEMVGFSYSQNHISEKMVDQYFKLGIADFSIGILHGNFGSRTEHGNYAPFTIGDLRAKDFQYWALGHIHKRDIVSTAPHAVYPGSLVGRNRKETGEKGFYLVTLDETECHLDFIEAAEVKWLETEIIFEEVTGFDRLITEIQKKLKEIKDTGSSVLLEIRLDFSACANIDHSILKEEEILDALQNEEDDDIPFVWIHRLELILPQGILESGHILKDLYEVADTMTIKELREIISPLTSHVDVNKNAIFSDLEDDLLQDLIEDAKVELVRQWGTIK